MQNMNPKIIFEDTALLVIDKPAGWIVNDAISAKDQPVVQNWIRENFDFPIAHNADVRNGIVHRLDKETSGLLVIAKTEEAFTFLQKQFKERKTKKVYRALVHGTIREQEGTIDAPVGRLPWRRDRFGVLPGGRTAVTGYKVMATYKNKHSVYSLVELYPETGRTHQIRIHMKHIGHPLVADEFYAGRKTSRSDRKWCPRLFLHAYSLSIGHPMTSRELSFSVNLPIDLERALLTLEKLSDSK